MKQLASVLLVVALLAVSAPGRGAEPEYFVFVASESADRLSLLRFTAEGGRIVRETETGVMPTGVDGPQGLAVSPDGRFYYASPRAGDASCSPTWPQQSTDGRSVYVACNASNELVEIDPILPAGRERARMSM